MIAFYFLKAIPNRFLVGVSDPTFHYRSFSHVSFNDYVRRPRSSLNIVTSLAHVEYGTLPLRNLLLNQSTSNVFSGCLRQWFPTFFAHTLPDHL